MDIKPASQADRKTPSGQPARGLAAVILAAGQSTRMKTRLPKVMHEVCGQPMLAHVLNACRGAGITKLYVVVGFGGEVIQKAFAKDADVEFVQQAEQLGTGHAVQMCSDALRGFAGDVVVVAGDMPMIRSETLRDLVGGHRATGSAGSLATTVLEDPTGYGRIIRKTDGEFERIVEQRDCTDEQLNIREVNPSYYCFDWQTLVDSLARITPDNAKKELYLTDTMAIIRESGKTVRASTSVAAEDAVGINSRADLAGVNRLMQRRIQTQWMDTGVTIVDPNTTWLDGRCVIGRESVIQPFTCIEGGARIGRGGTIGPYALLRDGVVVEDGVTVGPGALNAFDAAARGRSGDSHPPEKSRAVRRPPARTGCE